MLILLRHYDRVGFVDFFLEAVWFADPVYWNNCGCLGHPGYGDKTPAELYLSLNFMM
jgi:hypothetical protein